MQFLPCDQHQLYRVETRQQLLVSVYPKGVKQVYGHQVKKTQQGDIVTAKSTANKLSMGCL